MRAPATAFLLVLFALQPARAENTDVVIGAGHQGRPQSCIALAVKACNLGTGLGTQLERRWTPVVADAAAAELRRDGVRVVRRPADYAAHDRAQIAVFLHFDGSAPACRSGASIGFPPGTDRSFVRAWETRYRALFPFRFAGENITQNEARYYGYRKVTTPGKSMLIEFGEMTCPEQERWLEPRLNQLGVVLAQFIRAELHP
jgi:hypothetical protein